MEMYVIIFITIPIHSFILAKSKCFYKFTLQLCDYKSHSRSLVSSSFFFFISNVLFVSGSVVSSSNFPACRPDKHEQHSHFYCSIKIYYFPPQNTNWKRGPGSSWRPLLLPVVSKLVPVCDSDRKYAVSLSEKVWHKGQSSVREFDLTTGWRGLTSASVRVGLSSQLVTVEGTSEKAQQPTGTLSGLSVCSVLNLGPPALYELCDLGDVESAQVEVMWQDVLGQLHQEAAVDPLPLKDGHRRFGEADEPQARRHLLQRQGGQVRRWPPGGVRRRRQAFVDPHTRSTTLCASEGICRRRIGGGLRGRAGRLAVKGVQRTKRGKSTLRRRRPESRSRGRRGGGEGVRPRLHPGSLRRLRVGCAVCRNDRGRLRTGRVGSGAVGPGAGVTVQGGVWRGGAAETEQEKWHQWDTLCLTNETNVNTWTETSVFFFILSYLGMLIHIN